MHWSCPKWVGTRLRNLNKKDSVVNSIIDKLHNYNGIAVKSNDGNLAAMKKAIYVTLFQVDYSAKNNWHGHCPDREESQCRFTQDKATDKSTYKSGVGVVLDIIMTLPKIMNC